MLVAILDDDTSRRLEMERSLTEALPNTTLQHFDNAPDMIAWLARNMETVSLISLAHDLGPSRLRDGMLFDPGTGRDVTDFMLELDEAFPVVVHARTCPGSRTILAMLERAGWPSVRVQPKSDLKWIKTAWLPAVTGLLDETDSA